MGNLCYIKLIILVIIMLVVLDLRFNFSGEMLIPGRGPGGAPVGRAVLREGFRDERGQDYSWGGRLRTEGTDVSLMRDIGDIDVKQLARFYRR